MQLEMKDLDSTARKIGTILILNVVLSVPMSYIVLKLVNLFKIEAGNGVPFAILLNFLLFMILASLLLKVNMKEIFINKKRANKIGLKSVILLYVFLLAAYIFLSMCINFPTGLYKVINERYEYIFSSNTALIMMVMASIWEEIFFRGVLLEKLREYGDVFAILTSAVIFGILHGIRFIHATILGIMTGFLYVVGGGITWPILFHFLINFGFGSEFLENALTALFSEVAVVDETFMIASIIILSAVLLVVSFMLCRKDDTLVELRHSWNINVIVNQIKQDKTKYKIFFRAPMIIIFFIFQVIMMVIGSI